VVSGQETGGRRMRAGFEEFLCPDDAYWKRLSSNGTYAFDANVLFDFYRYTEGTRNEMFEAVAALGDRGWVPHQVAYEFHSGRFALRQSLVAEYATLKNALEAAKVSIDRNIPTRGRHPYLGTSVDPALTLESLDELIAKVEDAETMHRAELSGSPLDDAIGDQVLDLFANRVGPAFDPDRLQSIRKAGKDRYEKKVPPGYKDEGKDRGDPFGDLLVWHQLLDRAKETGEPVLFVTNDAKEDWVWKVSGKTIGPRHELVREMLDFASVRFNLQSSQHFAETTSRLTPSAAAEVSELTERHEMATIDIELLKEQLRSTYGSDEARSNLIRNALQSVRLFESDDARSNFIRDAIQSVRLFESDDARSNFIRDALQSVRLFESDEARSNLIRDALDSVRLYDSDQAARVARFVAEARSNLVGPLAEAAFSERLVASLERARRQQLAADTSSDEGSDAATASGVIQPGDLLDGQDGTEKG
jgi:hypothetical protein